MAEVLTINTKDGLTLRLFLCPNTSDYNCSIYTQTYAIVTICKSLRVWVIGTMPVLALAIVPPGCGVYRGGSFTLTSRYLYRFRRHCLVYR
jgi:hypothetical protein